MKLSEKVRRYSNGTHITVPASDLIKWIEQLESDSDLLTELIEMKAAGAICFYFASFGLIDKDDLILTLSKAGRYREAIQAAVSKWRESK